MAPTNGHTNRNQYIMDNLDFYANWERERYRGFDEREAEQELAERKAAIAENLRDCGVDMPDGEAGDYELRELQGMLEEARREWMAANPEERGEGGECGKEGGGEEAA